jgi:hypothetical protein
MGFAADGNSNYEEPTEIGHIRVDDAAVLRGLEEARRRQWREKPGHIIESHA